MHRNERHARTSFAGQLMLNRQAESGIIVLVALTEVFRTVKRDCPTKTGIRRGSQTTVGVKNTHERSGKTANTAASALLTEA